MKKIAWILLILLLSGCCSRRQISLTESNGMIQGWEVPSSAGELTQSYLDAVTFSIDEADIKSESGTAQVTVTTPDLEQILPGIIQESIAEVGTEDYDLLLNTAETKLQDKLHSGDCPTRESTIQMPVSKSEDGYFLVSNTAFEDVLYGSLSSLFLNTLTEE